MDENTAAAAPPPANEGADPPGERAIPPGSPGVPNGAPPQVSTLADLANVDALPPAPGSEVEPPKFAIGETQVDLGALVEALNGEHGDAVLKAVKRKIKAAGEEVEISLLEALGEVPKARGFHKNMHEVSRLRKDVRGVVEDMGSDPIGAYMRLYGEQDRAKVAQFFADHALAEMRRGDLSPEQQAYLEQQEQLQRDAEAGRRLMQKEQREQMAREDAQMREQVMPMIHDALKGVGLPAKKHQIGRLSGIMADWHRRGVISGPATPAQLQEAARIVREEYSEERGGMYGELTGEDLLSAIGDDSFALRVARAVGARFGAHAKRDEVEEGVVTDRRSRRQDPSEITNMRDWKKQADARMKRRK